MKNIEWTNINIIFVSKLPFDIPLYMFCSFWPSILSWSDLKPNIGIGVKFGLFFFALLFGLGNRTEDDFDVIVDDLLDMSPFENTENCLIFVNGEWQLLLEISMAAEKIESIHY